MSLVINTNVSSLNSQRQLMQSNQSLDQATERLSSGQRINSAKDDAAGLAISNRMTSQVRGLDQAVRNANDGISMIQTAEGALQETTNILQRMRELSVQSANGIYTDGDRETLNSEVEQLREEMNRIAAETSFNGQKLLDGALGQVDLQVGDQSRQIISLEVPAMDADNLGGDALGDIVGSAMTFDSAPDGNGDILALDETGGTEVVSINGTDILTSDLNGATTVNELLGVINDAVDGVTASAVTEVVGDPGMSGIITDGNSMNFTVTDADGNQSTFSVSDTENIDDLAATINKAAGGKIDASVSDDGELVLSNDSGSSIDVSYLQSDGTTTWAEGADATGIAEARVDASLVLDSDDGNGVTVEYDTPADADLLGIDERGSVGEVTGQANGTQTALAAGDLTINGVAVGSVSAGTDPTEQAENIAAAINKVSDESGVTASSDTGVLTLKSSTGDDISIAFKGEASQDTTGLQETNSTVSFDESIANIDISTQEGAQNAIDTIDRALVEINDVRADLGAANNRLDFTISNLSNVSEKTSAARSRIMDADFAAETAKLSQAQVLQQASQAMLAQANARPQQVLQLLQ